MRAHLTEVSPVATPRPIRRTARPAAPAPAPPPEQPANASAPQLPRGARIGAGAVVALLGLIFLLIGLKVRATSNAAASWPTVEGIVESSRVVSRQERDDDGRSTIMYSPNVVFGYTVRGRSLKSAKIAPVESSSSSDGDANATVRRYPAGGRVQVHYNPDSPAEAYLETSAGAAPAIFIVIGLIALLGGGAILFGAFRTSAPA